MLHHGGIVRFMQRKTHGILALITTALLLTVPAVAQEEKPEEAPSQVVKGTVINVQTEQPVPGASVTIVGTKLGGITKVDGSFRIHGVPVGHYTIRVSSVGYEPAISDITVTSGRQTVLGLTLQETVIRGKEVTVSGDDPFKVINEAALVSANAFSLDDVKRYAGSREDPARMAQNFAGVLGGSGIRNDIVIRGGSPTELLWRLDGVDIPNPNHFATQGATGGPVSVINANLLANSDFLTGAFPAEYGNKLSGVFDLRTRKGNSEKYEFVAQMGFNGFEGMAEGPVGDGSFIGSYRYSTLQVFDALGINLGIDFVPKYQDATVKIGLPLGERDDISAIALGGISDIAILASTKDSVYTGDMDIRNGTNLGVVGINWRRLFSDQVVGKLMLSTVYSRYRVSIDSNTTDESNHLLSLTPWLTANSTESYSAARYNLSYAPDPSNYFTGGIEGRLLHYDLDQRRLLVGEDGSRYTVVQSGNTPQALGFLNWNWRPTGELTFNSGIHTQYLGISRKLSVEPRFSAAYSLTPTQTVNVGFGVHRQSHSLLVYFYSPQNQALDFTQALHYIAGYTNQLGENLLLKVECYYKDISNAPVMSDSATSYSLLNVGAAFGSVDVDRDLVNEGKGRNYGAELTLMKHFSDGYYLTLTGSYVRQEYTGSDGIWRVGAFDNQYIANILAGYEWKITPGFAIEFSGKFTVAGGAPYTPVDLAKSRMLHGTYYDVGSRFSERNTSYSRLDVRADFRSNFGSWSLISYFSVENILNRRNIQEREYNARFDRVDIINQTGVFPVGGVRVEF